jgi:hypothetical protein
MERDIDLLWEELSLDPEFIKTRNQDFQQFIDYVENSQQQPQPKKEPLWKTYHREGLKRLNEQQKKWDNLNKK